MSVASYPIILTEEKRERLTRLIRTGQSSAYEQIVARMLLKADHSQQEPPSDGEIAQTLEISRRTAIRLKQKSTRQAVSLVETACRVLRAPLAVPCYRATPLWEPFGPANRDGRRASVLRRKTHDHLENELVPPPEKRRSTIRTGRVSSRDSPSRNRRT